MCKENIRTTPIKNLITLTHLYEMSSIPMDGAHSVAIHSSTEIEYHYSVTVVAKLDINKC